MTGFSWVQLVFFLVSPELTGFYLVLLGFTWFRCKERDLDRLEGLETLMIGRLLTKPIARRPLLLPVGARTLPSFEVFFCPRGRRSILQRLSLSLSLSLDDWTGGRVGSRPSSAVLELPALPFAKKLNGAIERNGATTGARFASEGGARVPIAPRPIAPANPIGLDRVRSIESGRVRRAGVAR